jgi:hypothetical protein
LCIVAEQLARARSNQSKRQAVRNLSQPLLPSPPDFTSALADSRASSPNLTRINSKQQLLRIRCPITLGFDQLIQSMIRGMCHSRILLLPQAHDITVSSHVLDHHLVMLIHGYGQCSIQKVLMYIIYAPDWQFCFSKEDTALTLLEYTRCTRWLS